ncbi:MAG: nitroreductase family protein [Dehalococcoidia bacterium]
MQPITEAMDLFRHQRAVRAWADRDVSDEVLRQILQAAIHAPSGSNTQPWRFIVVRDPVMKARISEEYEAAQGDRGGAAAGGGIMAQAPVLIIPCVRVPERTGRTGFQTGASIYPACQNLMLAARALGLGSVLTTTHRIRAEQVHALLGIPPTYDSAAIIPLGWPDHAYGPNRRPPLEEFVSYDGWSA